MHLQNEDNKPVLSLDEIKKKKLVTLDELKKMHLQPTAEAKAILVDENGNQIAYYSPNQVEIAPVENWYQEKITSTETMTLPSGKVIPKMSVRRAQSYDYYSEKALNNMNYDIPEEPVAYYTKLSKTVFFYDKKKAIRRPLPCVVCGAIPRYKRKLCLDCFKKQMAEQCKKRDVIRLKPYNQKRERTLFFDLELTGVYDHDEILSISVVDGNGTILMDTLVKPARKKSWKETEKIHGITPAMVADAPSLQSLVPQIQALFEKADAVLAYGISTDYAHICRIYNSAKEKRQLKNKCKDIYIEYTHYIEDHELGQFHYSLTDAMAYFNIEWDGVAHTSIADTIGCAKVWEKIFPNYYEKD